MELIIKLTYYRDKRKVLTYIVNVRETSRRIKSDLYHLSNDKTTYQTAIKSFSILYFIN